MGRVDIELIKEDERLSIKLLVNHHSKDTHLSSTSVIQFPGTQVNHILLSSGPGSESNGEGGGTEVSGEGSLLLLPQNFQKSSGQGNGDQILSTNLENGLCWIEM